MKHHSVKLNYGANGFLPVPKIMSISKGDTISFKLGTAPPNSTFRITLDPKCFSVSVVTDSQTKVTVLQAAATTYKCELLDALGNPVNKWGTKAAHQSGGGTRPT